MRLPGESPKPIRFSKHGRVPLAARSANSSIGEPLDKVCDPCRGRACVCQRTSVSKRRQPCQCRIPTSHGNITELFSLATGLPFARADATRREPEASLPQGASASPHRAESTRQRGAQPRRSARGRSRERTPAAWWFVGAAVPCRHSDSQSGEGSEGPPLGRCSGKGAFHATC